jgi:hypothetical protein
MRKISVVGQFKCRRKARADLPRSFTAHKAVPSHDIK